jgi:hypothetical protein
MSNKSRKVVFQGSRGRSVRSEDNSVTSSGVEPACIWAQLWKSILVTVILQNTQITSQNQRAFLCFKWRTYLRNVLVWWFLLTKPNFQLQLIHVLLGETFTLVEQWTSSPLAPLIHVSNIFSLLLSVSREYGRKDPSRRPPGAIYLQKSAIASPTIGGHSAGIVRSRTQDHGVS